MTNDFNLDAMCSAAMRNVLRCIHSATSNAQINVGLDFIEARDQMENRHDDRMTLRSVQAECSPSDFKSYQLMKLGELFGLPYEGLAQDFEKLRLQRIEWIYPRVITTAWPTSTSTHETKARLLVADEMKD